MSVAAGERLAVSARSLEVVHDPLTFVDVFAGGGGLSEGFVQAGYDPIAHVEADQAACYTLRTRLAYHWLASEGHEDVYADYLEGHIGRENLYAEVPQDIVSSVIHQEIRQDTLESIFREIDSRLRGRKLDLLVGGPPCQAYSVVGRSRDPKGMLDDKRNYLYRCYAGFLDKFQPKRFVFENVKGLLSAKDGTGRSYLNEMQSLFRSLGYETQFSTLYAQEHGVLQSRKRVVLIGNHDDMVGPFPHPAPWKPNVNVSEVFADLPAIGAGGGGVVPCQRRPYKSSWQVDAGVRSALPLTWHQARPHTDQDLEIYRIAVRLWNEHKTRLKYGSLPERLKTHRNGGSFTDRFKVVADDLPFSQTVVAHICKDGHYYIHPDLEQNRSITPREAARLQTFPDDYYFESVSGRPARTHAFRQIGNAVPVLLSRRIAESLSEHWDA